MNFKVLGIPTHSRFRPIAQWIAIAVIAYSPVQLHAEEGLRTYIAPGITFMRSDDARVSEEGYGLSLGVGIAGDSPLGYEASLLLNEFEESGRNTPGWREWGVRGGVQYFFHRDAIADRFLDVGLSAVRTERTDINDATTSAALDFGIGLEHNILGSGTRLRGGVRYRILFHDALSGLPEQNASTFDEIGVHFGLLFGRGHGGGAPAQDQVERTQIFVYTSPETVRAAAEVGLPYATLRGGEANLQGLNVEEVSGSDDSASPDLTAQPASQADSNAESESTSAEAAEAASEAGANDNIAAAVAESDVSEEAVDREQTVEKEIPVLVSPDFPNICDDPAVGACELPDEIKISRSFRSGSYELSASAAERLQAIAPHLLVALESRPGAKIIVEGHTDSTGSQGYNRWLSKRRAQAVRVALSRHGIAIDDIEAMGLGSEFPISSNATLEGQLDNRRIEIGVAGGVQSEQDD